DAIDEDVAGVRLLLDRRAIETAGAESRPDEQGQPCCQTGPQGAAAGLFLALGHLNSLLRTGLHLNRTGSQSNRVSIELVLDRTRTLVRSRGSQRSRTGDDPISRPSRRTPPGDGWGRFAFFRWECNAYSIVKACDCREVRSATTTRLAITAPRCQPC